MMTIMIMIMILPTSSRHKPLVHTVKALLNTLLFNKTPSRVPRFFIRPQPLQNHRRRIGIVSPDSVESHNLSWCQHFHFTVRQTFEQKLQIFDPDFIIVLRLYVGITIRRCRFLLQLVGIGEKEECHSYSSCSWWFLTIFIISPLISIKSLLQEIWKSVSFPGLQ